LTPPDTNDSFADEVEDRLEKLFGEDFLADDDPADTTETPEESVSDDVLSIVEEDAEDQLLEDAESTKAVDPEDLISDVGEDAPAQETEDSVPGAVDIEITEDKVDPLPDDDFMEPDDGVDSDPSTNADSPLRELQAIVLSIDWEINDDVMTRFADQIAALQSTFKDDKIALVFLQLLNSIGEYIRVNLGRSHPDAFKILNSLFVQMDKVVNSTAMTGTEKKKALAVELEKYKNLKNRLTPEPTVDDAQGKVDEQEEPTGADIDIRKVYDVVNEMKQMFQSEIMSLRKEIHQIKNLLDKQG
jgi:flagellar biosynthesis regulator FlbT